MDRRRIQILGALLLVAVMGCEKQTAAAPTVASPMGTATIVGRVVLRGQPPALPLIDVSSVADCAKLHPNGIPDEAIVAAPDGALQNVIVYLEGAPSAAGKEASLAAPVVLDQMGCRYLPHVVALQTGQTLRVQSSDPFLHNVHVLSTSNPAENFAELASAGNPSSSDLHFAQPEIFQVKCDVHPWMRAWVGVFNHPYFAVTPADGSFRIERVPAGHFTLVAWQERLGRLSQTLAVADGQSVNVELDYSH